MSDMDIRDIEKLVRNGAQDFAYPPTPDLSVNLGRTQRRPTSGRRKWAQYAAIASILLIAFLSVPTVRAKLLEVLQIGGISILLPETESAQPLATATSLLFESTLPAPILPEALSGRANLEEAGAQLGLELALPSYPVYLGEPDEVFLQEPQAGEHFAILVWRSDKAIDLVLYVISPGVFFGKGAPQNVEEVEIGGRPGAYLEGEHLLVVRDNVQVGVLVSGPALVWEGEDGFTYRIEGPYALDEMIRIAESIH